MIPTMAVGTDTTSSQASILTTKRVTHPTTTSRALSLLQPYATLLLLGCKTYETRSWRTHYRGELVIHASLGRPAWARRVAEQNPLIAHALATAGLRFDELPRGALLGVTELLDLRPITARFAASLPALERAAGDYSLPDRWAWLLGPVEAYPSPISCPGALTLWTVPTEVARRCPPRQTPATEVSRQLQLSL